MNIEPFKTLVKKAAFSAESFNPSSPLTANVSRFARAEALAEAALEIGARGPAAAEARAGLTSLSHASTYLRTLGRAAHEGADADPSLLRLSMTNGNDAVSHFERALALLDPPAPPVNSFHMRPPGL